MRRTVLVLATIFLFCFSGPLSAAGRADKTGERLVQQILEEIEKSERLLVRVGTVASAKGGSGRLTALPDACKTPVARDFGEISSPNVAKPSGRSKSKATTPALMKQLREVRQEVERSHDFLVGLCKGCRLLKKDKRLLRDWLTATKKETLAQRARLRSYVRRATVK